MIQPNCSPQMWYNLHFTLIIFYPDLYLHIISFLRDPRDLRDTNNNSEYVLLMTPPLLSKTSQQSYSNQKIIYKVTVAHGGGGGGLQLPGPDRLVCLDTPQSKCPSATCLRLA